MTHAATRRRRLIERTISVILLAFLACSFSEPQVYVITTAVRG